MTSFLSTYVNKVDKKGRVSVPAPYRAALADQPFQGLLAYASLTHPAIEAMGRDVLDRMSAKRLEQQFDDGAFEAALIGAQEEDAVDIIMAMSRELPFDGEGRIVLPQVLAGPAGITDQVAFVGRGSRFQLWAPDRWERHQAEAIERLRSRRRGVGS